VFWFHFAGYDPGFCRDGLPTGELFGGDVLLAVVEGGGEEEF